MERPQFQLCFKDFCEGCREMDVTHETLYADGIPFIVTISCSNLERCQRLEKRFREVEVVRCKDCKWRGRLGCAVTIVDESDEPKDDDFCSFGERREDGDSN